MVNHQSNTSLGFQLSNHRKQWAVRNGHESESDRAKTTVIELNTNMLGKCPLYSVTQIHM